MTIKHWDKGGRIFDRKPLRRKVSDVLYKLKVQETRLAERIAQMEARDKELFQKCSQSRALGDNQRAALYANECAELRKISKAIIRAHYALEQVTLRLETILDYGDITVTVKPLSEVVGSLSKQLSGIIPEVSRELENVGEDLNSMVLEIGESVAPSAEVIASTEANRILEEASAIAEQRIHERFPEIQAIDRRISEAPRK
ncbi:MAG: Snf7 family protein [Candidatus Bathyarchaeia archaeon]